MANNLNQLARQANTYGFHQMAIEVGNVAKKVDDLLIRFSEKRPHEKSHYKTQSETYKDV